METLYTRLCRDGCTAKVRRELRELRGSEAGDLLFWDPGKPSQDGDIPICQIPACQKVVGVPDPKGVIISTRRRQI